VPFGEELFAPAGGRTAAQGYATGDGLRQQFTQKERDIETGLDYFSSRYYQSTQGRFTSADSFSGRITNPQTLNLYSYVKNSPLKFIDPTGHFAQDPATDVVTIIVHDRWYHHIWPSIKNLFRSKSQPQKTSPSLPEPIPSAHPSPTPVRIRGAIGVNWEKSNEALVEWLNRPESIPMMIVPGTIPFADPFADSESLGGLVLEESNVDLDLSTTAPAVPKLVQTVDSILMPGGSPLGQTGSSSNIRELTGGLAAAQKMFGELSQGGTTVTNASYPGTLVKLANGGTVGLRTVMSKSPDTAATIDVNIRGIPITKLKFN